MKCFGFNDDKFIELSCEVFEKRITSNNKLPIWSKLRCVSKTNDKKLR